jgi:formylglycine-generating enzyme required for sulfatase activity/serine/threonine protein kinase
MSEKPKEFSEKNKSQRIEPTDSREQSQTDPPQAGMTQAYMPSASDDTKTFSVGALGLRNALAADSFAQSSGEAMSDETIVPTSGTVMIGGYELLQEIARGGMGVVYKARQVALDRTVALKLVLSGREASSSEVSRFQIEAKAAAKLDHPYIVPVYEISQFNGQQFFSMSFVDGPSLSGRLAKDGPMPYREAAELMRNVSEAVHYAHRQGVVHRDLKPGNILITADGDPKVTDFGLAKQLDSQQSLTATGQILGTPSYMAPEQALGDNSAIGPWTDIYSLGATLFAALVGRPPFAATAIHELLICVTEQPAPSLRTINPRIPASLDAIVLKCLAKTANERYSTAGELATALKEFLESDWFASRTRPVGQRIAIVMSAVVLVLATILGGIWLGRPLGSDHGVAGNGSAGNLNGPQSDPTEAAVRNDSSSGVEKEIPSADQIIQQQLLAARDLLLPDPKGDIWAFRYGTASAEYSRVLGELGFKPDETDAATWSASLQDRSTEFRESIVLALEIWELCAVAEKSSHVNALREAQDALETLDWRRTVRLARSDGDERILLQAIREALSESPSTEQIEWLALFLASRSPEANAELLGVLRGLVQLASKSFVANTAFGIVLRRVGRVRPREGISLLSESVLPLRAAVKSRSDHPLPQAQLVSIYLELGNQEAANKERERLYQLSYPVAWPLVLEARNARIAKKYEEAIGQLRQAILSQEDVPDGKIELAAALILNEQNNEAEPLLKQLIQSAKDDGAAYQTLIEVFRIVEQTQSGPATRQQSNPAAVSAYSDRIWDLFSTFRQSYGAAPSRAVNPFNADQAQAYQEAWAEYLGVPIEYTNSIGMKFRLIPPGEYIRGSEKEEVEAAVRDIDDPNWTESLAAEAPAHRVVISTPFFMAIHEVTQGQYKRVTNVNPSLYAPTGEGAAAVAGMDHSEFPVEQIKFADANRFCEQLIVLEKRADDTYELPTEAQWEYACRAGTTSRYWPGNTAEDLQRTDWVGSNSEIRTHAVGGLPANPFGLFDLHGNVWEFCRDAWDPESYRQFVATLAVDPIVTSPSPTKVTLRGGDYGRPASFCRAPIRHPIPIDRWHSSVGMRLVLTVKAVQEELAVMVRKPPLAVAPFDADQAKSHQEAWAEFLGVPIDYTNSIGMEFRLIPPGTFQMGSTDAEIEDGVKAVPMFDWWQAFIRSEKPIHHVVLTQPFYFGKFEVTQKQYETVIGTNPSAFSPAGRLKHKVMTDTNSFPVETVSALDAADFCKRMSEQEREQDGQSITGENYRLPTEAEWEYACRAGTITRYWSGDDASVLPDLGWNEQNSGGSTHTVGGKAPNPFGLYDLNGNVWEWVGDRWDPNYYMRFSQISAVDPQGTAEPSVTVIMRGGGYPNHIGANRSAARMGASETIRNVDMGFRVVLSAKAVRDALQRVNAAKP